MKHCAARCAPSIVRAQVHADRIDLDVSATQLARRLLSDGGAEGVPESDAHVDGGKENLVRSSIPARLKRTGKEMTFIVDGPTISAPADTSLIRLLVRAQKIGERLFDIGGPNLDQIAGEENITPSYASRIVRLKFLAPDIVAAILAGKQPPELTANKLMADTRLPLDWRDQRTALGFACAIRHIQRYRRRRAKRRSQQRQLTHGKARASARNGRSKATSPCRAVGDPRTTQSPPAQRHPYH